MSLHNNTIRTSGIRVCVSKSNLDVTSLKCKTILNRFSKNSNTNSSLSWWLRSCLSVDISVEDFVVKGKNKSWLITADSRMTSVFAADLHRSLLLIMFNWLRYNIQVLYYSGLFMMHIPGWTSARLEPKMKLRRSLSLSSVCTVSMMDFIRHHVSTDVLHKRR